MCFAVARSEVTPTQAVRLPFSCVSPPAGYQDGWLWLRADREHVAALPPEWRLLVDQTRFESMRLITIHEDGSARQKAVRSGRAHNNWAVGGFITFQSGAQQSKVTGVYLGFERLTAYQTMRKIRIVSEDGFNRTQILWVALMAGFAGIVGGSFVYTAFLYAGLRHRFLSQHALWCLAMLTYGLCWSNIVFYAAPWLAGSWGVRLNLVTGGLSALAATRFMIDFLEADTLSPRLRRLVVGGGWATFLGSCAAALDFVGPTFAHFTDRIANAAVGSGVLIVLACLGLALRRRSRAAFFYALSWSPTLAVLALRSIRNFYLVPHADWMDMAMFGAVAFQALLLSAAIAHRFQSLQIERDKAEAERNAFSHLANHDPLTGIKNRRGFVTRAERMIAADHGRPVWLLLLDLDHFKRINDRFGHQAGDDVLIAVGRMLATFSDAETGVARMGGEEFGVVAVRQQADATALAEELRQRVSELTFCFGREQVTITASVGLAQASNGASFQDVFSTADAALYRAKADGRNRIVGVDGPRRAAA